MKKKNRIGRPNFLLLFFANLFLRPIYKKKFGFSLEKDFKGKLKGPCIVIAPHVSDKDHIIAGLSLYPARPTFVVSEHFVRNKKTKRLLKYAKVITKRMFCADAGAIINIMRAKRENNIVFIFPEGRLTCSGRSLPVTEGSAELIKKFDSDLYLLSGNGAGLTFPKWRDRGTFRKGKIKVTLKKLLSKEEIENMNLSDLKDLVDSSIRHDEEKAMEGTYYYSNAMAEGLDRILYVCPSCKRCGFLYTKGNVISCQCGFSAELDNYYKFKNCPFKTVNEWFDYQENSLDLDVPLASQVKIGTVGEDGFMDENAGEGSAYLDRETFILSGTVHNESVSINIKTDSIGAFPITAGEHFDIYYKNKLYYVYPMPDKRSSVLWVSFIDKLNREKNINKTERKEFGITK